MYYLLLPDLDTRTRVIDVLKDAGIAAVFHYVPLHSAPAGRRYGRTDGPLPVTDDTSDRLLRLPLWIGVADEVERVCDVVTRALAIQ
jgi:dTDP-4-amino-4,6-dideoxygalactose transaminase